MTFAWCLLLAGPANATATNSPSIGGNFSLTAHDGSRFELANLRGSIVLIYFGFTSCPAICPMELSNIGRTLNALPDLELTGLFITVDPARDTAEKLAVYVPYFHPDIIGLTGTDAEIRTVADQYNVVYNKVGEGENYSMDHSSHIFVLDGEGEIRALAPFGSTPEDLQRLIREIANHADN